jgi:hypothetical protein
LVINVLKIKTGECIMTQFQENEKNYRDEEESPVADDQDTSEEPAYWSEH